jgi:zinc protease
LNILHFVQVKLPNKDSKLFGLSVYFWLSVSVPIFFAAHGYSRQLEAMGVKFGVHQNAYTSFHETVYELHVPIRDCAPGDTGSAPPANLENKPTAIGKSWPLLQNSLKILRTLAIEMRISDEDVDAERTIVLEEWRQRRTAQGRAQEAYVTIPK